MKLKDLVRNNNIVKFDSYRAGFFYYIVEWTDLSPEESMGVPDKYLFPIPVEDIGNATLLSEDKAITFMRWIRKAIDDKTLIKQR